MGESGVGWGSHAPQAPPPAPPQSCSPFNSHPEGAGPHPEQEAGSRDGILACSPRWMRCSRPWMGFSDSCLWKNANRRGIISTNLYPQQSHPHRAVPTFSTGSSGLEGAKRDLFQPPPQTQGEFTALSSAGCSAHTPGAPENPRGGSGMWD